MLSESIPRVNCVMRVIVALWRIDKCIWWARRRSLSPFPPVTPTLHRFVSRVPASLVVTFPLQASYMSRNTELSSQITGIRRVDRVNSLFSSQETKEKKIKSQQRTRIASPESFTGYRIHDVFSRNYQKLNIFIRNWETQNNRMFLNHQSLNFNNNNFFH